MADNKPIGVDADGYEVLRDAMQDLLNQFPALLEGEKVTFEDLKDDSGLAFTSNSGTLVYSEKTYVSGTKFQDCRYPFLLIYRASSSAREKQKITILEFLDAFGKWLCKETAVIDGEEYKLKSYPVLGHDREIKSISRENPYGSAPMANGVQDWVLPLTVSYTATVKP